MAAKTKTEPMTLGNMLCGRPYRSGRSPHWIKVKNPDAPAATRIIECRRAKRASLAAPFRKGWMRRREFIAALGGAAAWR